MSSVDWSGRAVCVAVAENNPFGSSSPQGFGAGEVAGPRVLLPPRASSWASSSASSSASASAQVHAQALTSDGIAEADVRLVSLLMSDGDAQLDRQMRADFRHLCPDARRLLLDRRVFNAQLNEYGAYEYEAGAGAKRNGN